MPAHDLMLDVAAEPRLLCTVRSAVRCYLHEAGFESERTDTIVLGVDEACSNAIRHAYQGDRDRTFRVTIRRIGGWIEIELRDAGVPAGAAVSKPVLPDLPPDVQSASEGGWGMHFIRSAFDEVEFSPGETQGNRITMKLREPNPAQK